jgi:large repetitive protein
VAVAYSHSGSAVTNSVAVTINAGDLVLVLINNADNTTPAGLTDNGGNSYILLVSDSAAARGASGLYYSIAAANATTVSFTTGHSPSLSVITFTGWTGMSIHSNGNGTTNTNITVSRTTVVANSILAGLCTYIKSGLTDSISAGTGTLRSSVNSTSTVNGGGTITTTAATPGSFTTAVTASAAPTGWVIFAVEVWSATYVDCLGKTPPQMAVIPIYREVPAFFGSGASSPITPVPVGVVLLSGTKGLAYSETITANGGTGPYTYAVSSGSLPTSLSLNTSTGVISGTPTAAGTYSFTIKATDTLGAFGYQNFQITIANPVSGGAFVFLG